MPETKYQRLIRLLKEMFQLGDAAELDFGIYRIMHARKAEIEKFLEKDLFQKHVKEALAGEAGGQRAKIEAEIAELEKQLRAAGVDPASAPKYKELVAKRETEPNQGALEDEVYGHLLTFFGRYYQEGDFISQRRYGENAYAIPYNGEEVKLYWANHDQYYIKSGEDLKHYAFLVGGKRVRFKLVAATTERDNAKEQKGKERYHIFAREGHAISEENGELVIPFEYRLVTREEIAEHAPEVGARPNMRDELSALSAKWILEDGKLPAAWKPLLTVAHKKDGEATGKSVIEHHVRRYMAKATFDYFIHKDLGGFLRRELDWFIKHELMQLEDILDEKQTPEQLGRRHFAKLRVLRAIADKLIEFLAQLEDFQKKLWLKKKFVLETHYLIRLGIVPEKFYPEIAANDAQRVEWVRLCAIDEIKKSTTSPAYSNPLTVEFLKMHPSLPLNTIHFNEMFRRALIGSFAQLNSITDGELLNSDNFQGLRLLHAKNRGEVTSIYIDPPYNTDASAIDYKNGYKSSSWSALMQNRVAESRNTLARDGVLVAAIDDEQQKELGYILSGVFSGDLLGTVVVRSNPSGRPTKSGYAVSHEYLIFAGAGPDSAIRRMPPTEEQAARFSETDEQGSFEWRNLRREGSNSDRSARRALYYPIYLLGESIRVPKLSWDESSENWVVLEEAKPGETVVWPKNEDGDDKTWRWEAATVMESLTRLSVRKDRSGKDYVYYKRRPNDEGVVAVSSWFEAKYSATEHGTAVLKNLFGRSPFAYPKSIYAVFDALYVAGASKAKSLVLDYFAGSGTTAHATMMMNREDNGQRRFILIEMAAYFDSVVVPRIVKVWYCPDWDSGRPARASTNEEIERSPRIVKVLRLESYEDACDNILFDRAKGQQEAFDKLPDAEREKYRLQYMLNVESRGSASLLNVQKFNRPFEYTLRVTRDDVTREQTVDLVETFNWLLGLRVDTIRLSKDSTFKATDHGILEVTGKDPQGNRCLVIWRNTDEVPDEKLLKWFENNRYKVKDFEWDLIYVNGDNTLENLKCEDQNWTVRLIEQEFHRLMFEGTE